MVNRSLPAVTTSLGLLAMPVLGIVSAAVVLREPLEPSLILAMAPVRLRPIFPLIKRAIAGATGLSVFRLSGRKTDARAGSGTVCQQR